MTYFFKDFVGFFNLPRARPAAPATGASQGASQIVAKGVAQGLTQNVAQELMERAELVAGRNPNDAAQLRCAARAFLRVVR